ncbi:MAG: ribosome silencing factor [Chromatiales bacterium]|nr:MAG: ribosome silencing factor [Chromatiales bacterium]
MRVTDSSALVAMAQQVLDDMKARDIRVLDVSGMTPITDYMVIASGTSRRHVKSIAERLVERAKADGHPPIGVEGTDAAEWVLVDLQDVVVHVMQTQVRDFYKLEKLWELGGDSTGSTAGAGA